MNWLVVILGGIAKGNPSYLFGYEVGYTPDAYAPEPPNDFTLTADPGGALECTISWINPSVNLVGNPLTELLEIRLYRDAVLIYTDPLSIIGAPCTYTDYTPSSGMHYYNLFAFGIGITIFGGSILISLASLNYNKLTCAIVAYIASYFVMFVYGFLLTLFERYKLNNERRRKLHFVEQFKVGFRGFISNIAGLLLFRIDLFIVGYFLTFKEVGVYSIALFSAEMVTKIPCWSAAILTPIVASNEKGHVRRTVYLFYTSIVLALLLGLLFIVIVSVFPDFISNIIGIDYKGVEICLLLLLPRVIMQSGVAVLAANLAGKGYPWYHPMGCIVPLLLLILFDFMLIPRLGVYGAALGSSLAFISSVIIFWIGFKKYNTPIAITVRSYVDTLVRSLGYYKYKE